jgi:hypothetical protein
MEKFNLNYFLKLNLFNSFFCSFVKRSSRAKKNHFLPLAPAQHNHRLLHEHSSLTDNGDQSRAGSVGNSHQAQQQQRITEDNIEVFFQEIEQISRNRIEQISRNQTNFKNFELLDKKLIEKILSQKIIRSGGSTTAAESWIDLP